MQVAFYGGSFDPPHLAHLFSAVLAASLGGFDKVLVMPVFEHPLGKVLSPFDLRVDLCRRCFDGFGRVEVSTLEAELERPSYTVRTLERLGRDHPDWQLRIVIGSDVLSDTSAWHDFDRVRKLAPPFVLARKGYESPELGPAVLPFVSSTRVRELLRRRDEPDALRELSFLVPERVLARVIELGIYR